MLTMKIGWQNHCAVLGNALRRLFQISLARFLVINKERLALVVEFLRIFEPFAIAGVVFCKPIHMFSVSQENNVVDLHVAYGQQRIRSPGGTKRGVVNSSYVTLRVKLAD